MRWRTEIAQALQGPLGNDPAPLPAGTFADDLRKESRFWADLFKELKIEPR